jgi:hypothetical protein
MAIDDEAILNASLITTYNKQHSLKYLKKNKKKHFNGKSFHRKLCEMSKFREELSTPKTSPTTIKLLNLKSRLFSCTLCHYLCPSLEPDKCFLNIFFVSFPRSPLFLFKFFYIFL